MLRAPGLGDAQGTLGSLGLPHVAKHHRGYWVAVRELNLSYYLGKPYKLLYIYIPIVVT